LPGNKNQKQKTEYFPLVLK